MSSTSTPLCFWKQKWRWLHSDAVNGDDVLKILNENNIKEQLKLGLGSYKPLVKDQHAELSKKYADQTKLLLIAQNLQKFIDVDTFQTWEIIMHYLCDSSYGTPSDVLKNVAFLDTRPANLLPKLFHFYRRERLFLLKLLKHLMEFKDDLGHKYHTQYLKIISEVGVQEIKTSLISQFASVLKSSPPPHTLHLELEENYFIQQWAQYNLWEQLEILQILILIADEVALSDSEFLLVFESFKKHDFGRKQSFNDFMDHRHKDTCWKIMLSEVTLFLVCNDAEKINSASCWIENTKESIEIELVKLQPREEHASMLLCWMLLTLQSDKHKVEFESRYQHFGITALKLQVFKFLHQMITNPVYKDDSKSSQICRMQVYELLNVLCDKFDGDGSMSNQPFIMDLCGELLSTSSIAQRFWSQFSKSDLQGVVSLWNTGLEYFPYNFHAVSVLSAGLAKAGKESAKKVTTELNSLPVFTTIFDPNAVRVTNICLDTGDVVVAGQYSPLDSSYKIAAGSSAALTERKEGTFIHFRTPVAYWTVLLYEIDRVLERRLSENEIEGVLNKIWDGSKLLKAVLEQTEDQSLASTVGSLVAIELPLRLRKLRTPPLPLLTSCLDVCTTVVRLYPTQVHARLLNTALLPQLTAGGLSHKELAGGAAFDSATVGSFLVGWEQPHGVYDFLRAYIDLLCAFSENATERILLDIFLPGVVFVLREVFPNLSSWRYSGASEKRTLTDKCVTVLTKALDVPSSAPTPPELLVQKTCIYSLLHLENSVELLKLVTVGDNQLQQMMCDETNWNSGAGCQYLTCMQRSMAILIRVLRLKSTVADSNELTPIEHLIFAQIKQNDSLRVIESITSYINHTFNQHLPELSCRLLNRLANEFQMSLFACLDMTSYQVRVLFLDRLQDIYESNKLKIAILDLVATCVSTQPGLTEAFFNLRLGKKQGLIKDEEKSEGILSYMADYLANVKNSSSCLYSPLLSCIMALFHSLWKNNMQILIKDLTENPKFWEHITSPLFNEIKSDLKAYAQTFNVLGIELFVRRENIDDNLKDTLQKFFNTDQKHLDKWIDYIYSFDGRHTTVEKIDEVPTWLGLLTSWKDFTTIFCKCLPIPLNIAHKSKMVSPCMKALLKELEDLTDSRLLVILSELYVIMLANWSEDCFDNRKVNVKQIDQLLNNANIAYESLHPRAKRAILSIATVAISTLDYEIKANSQLAQSIIRSVTSINSYELDNLYEDIRLQRSKPPEAKLNGHVNKGMEPVVLSLATLEQCLDLYDDMFSSLSQWFQSTHFVNKLLSCLQACLQNRKYYQTSLAALRCLSAYARGPFSKDLLFSDLDQFLWLQLLPPKNLSFEAGPDDWKPQEWWKVYSYSLDFISTMVMRHGQYFAGEAIMFVGVHSEQLTSAALLPRQYVDTEALDLCASAINLVRQLVRFQDRWKMENNNSLMMMMRSLSICLHHCVSLVLRARLLHQVLERPAVLEDQPTVPSDKVAKTLNRIMEIIHMATLSLIAFSPDLITLLSNCGIDVEKWQPLVELHFGTPKISYEPFPQLSFGTLLSAICLLTKSLNHTYHTEDASSPSRSRSPRGLSARRRPCSCSSPGDTPRRAARADSATSASSTASAVPPPWLAAFDKCLVANTLEALLTLLASQALLTNKDPSVAARDKQLVRRELGSELIVFQDFVRKRIVTHSKNVLVRNKLGMWPLTRNEDEARILAEVRREVEMEEETSPPPPPPPRRAAHDSMREFILRKQYLKATSTPVKEEFRPPVSHSTPAGSERRKEAKRVSWAETTQDDAGELSAPEPEVRAYSALTHVQVNNDEDYLHFMSVLLSYISQSDI